MFADIALPVPGLPPLTYRVPDGWRVEIGLRVAAPLGRRVLTGVVVKVSDQAPAAKAKIKNVVRVLDGQPGLPEELLALGQWISQYYFCSWGEALSAMLPGLYKPAGRERLRRAVQPPEGPPLTGLAHTLWDRLSDRTRGRADLLRDLPAGAAQTLTRLIQDGWVESVMHVPQPRAKTPAVGGAGPLEAALILTPHQRDALTAVQAALDQKKYQTFLLHGVTGSGKTEVYLQAIARVLEQGRTAILLVPEISLTPQACARIMARFGEAVAMLHSGMTPGERARAWTRLAMGQARVALGARSAVFAPLAHLGLIVVDEEYETTYKQEDVPRYHARDVAAVRAKACGAVLVLGSATPSVESYYNASQNRYALLKLPERVDHRQLPTIRVVDMSREFSDRQGVPLFSQELLGEIGQRLQQGEQSILFLNRRGFAPIVMCPSCRHVLTCPDCSVSLVYHRLGDRLACHACGRTFPARPACPTCGAACVRLAGAGTQRVEEELHALWPGARIWRLDQDATRRRGALETTLTAFGQGEGDILIGTQMVAKGIHFPQVTLVGIISADTALHFPDFRAEERAFQLIVQVAGRAGRGGRPGTVLVQTLDPGNPVMALAQKQNYAAFFERELAQRNELRYPPFTRLAKVVSKSRKPEKAWQGAEWVCRCLQAKAGSGDAILGPALAPREKIANEHYVLVLVKSTTVAGRRRMLGGLLEEKAPAGVKVLIDVDPAQMI